MVTLELRVAIRIEFLTKRAWREAVHFTLWSVKSLRYDTSPQQYNFFNFHIAQPHSVTNNSRSGLLLQSQSKWEQHIQLKPTFTFCLKLFFFAGKSWLIPFTSGSSPSLLDTTFFALINWHFFHCFCICICHRTNLRTTAGKFVAWTPPQGPKSHFQDSDQFPLTENCQLFLSKLRIVSLYSALHTFGQCISIKRI